MKKKMYGIEYELPRVYLLKESGLGVSEFAARTCYDSFSKSENEEIRALHKEVESGCAGSKAIEAIHDIEESALLDSLAWVHHHHSIIEHGVLSFLVKGTSRGVLQEHARHRLQSISVRSTRYTMGGVLNAYVAARTFRSEGFEVQKELFSQAIEDLDMLVVADPDYVKLESNEIFSKLLFQERKLGWEGFLELALSKNGQEIFDKTEKENYFVLLDALNGAKNKRNVGDAFKHIVSDNWKVDMVITFNLRSLKNYLDLRDSNAAYFQIRWLAQAIKEATPEKYLSLISKDHRRKG